MHDLMRVPEQDNPTSSMLTSQASFNLQRNPLLAVGTLDSEGRPWTTLWGGQPGFSQPLGGGMIGTRTIVDAVNDPVVRALVGGRGRPEEEKEDAVEDRDGEMVQPEGGKMVAGLSIDLMTRKRVKIAGRMIAGTVSSVDVEYTDSSSDSNADSTTTRDARPAQQDQIQLVTTIEQSLGNCPKYLNQYTLRPALISSTLVSAGPDLTEQAKSLISKADMFFLSSTTARDMDTNHRGGPPGFTRILSPSSLVYPEYSGNRLYQTLGNLQLNPSISLTFPDYSSGDVLYITGTAHILVSEEAAQVLPGSNLAVKVDVAEARYVANGLPFRGERKIPSPYNPLVRMLAGEGNVKGSMLGTIPQQNQRSLARLTQKVSLTPTIARFTFEVQNKNSEGIEYEPGQWIALDFKEHMDMGYSHMRDDDPQSLNDDFVRTFTISSSPAPATDTESKKQKTFDITIRNVGAVTSYLFRQNPRGGFEVPVLGVGGEFRIQQDEHGEKRVVTPFIAGGVGITPLLGHIDSLDITPDRFVLFWTLRLVDINLVLDTISQYPCLAPCMRVFFTGAGTGNGKDGSNSEQEEVKKGVKELEEKGVSVRMRRLMKQDLEETGADTWYLCAGKGFRQEVLGWLEGGGEGDGKGKGRRVVFEDFDY
jgi:ferredoxin-NADP reductase/predicted pyridoxine 5'-phosphate oxidase superfamily flavin-nucleotide-binding protein